MPHYVSDESLAQALNDGVCADPFGGLGPQATDRPGMCRLRVYVPGADAVSVVSPDGATVLAPLQAVDGRGLFAGPLDAYRYRLQVRGCTARSIARPLA